MIQSTPTYIQIVQQQGYPKGNFYTTDPTTGTITKVYISYFNGGTLSTTETGTFAIRLNNTTDYTVTSALINDAVTKDFSNTSMSVPVSAGDYIEFKVTVGAVTTAATSVRCSVVFFIE